MTSYIRIAALVLLGMGTAQANYFGYFRTYDNLNIDAIPSVADHANVAMIGDFGGSGSMTNSVLSEAAGYNMKAIISVWDVFFIGPTLNPNYLANWQAFSAAIAPNIGNVVAFLPWDEPNNGGPSVTAIWPAVRAIRATFPHIPIMVDYAINGSWDGINSQDPNCCSGSGCLHNPPNCPYLYDWAGFDCYDDGEPGAGGVPQCNGQSIQVTYNTMKAQLDPTVQRTFLIPEAELHVPEVYSTNAANLISELTWWSNTFKTDPMIVGMFPFLYLNQPGDLGRPDTTGTIANGVNLLQVANPAGWHINDPIAVNGAGLSGTWLFATITGINYNIFSLSSSALTSVVNGLVAEQTEEQGLKSLDSLFPGVGLRAAFVAASHTLTQPCVPVAFAGITTMIPATGQWNCLQ